MTTYSKKNQPEGFYVYFYLRSKDSKIAKAGTPYYVGKGSDGRAWNKHQKGIAVPKDNSNIIIVESCLTELWAFLLERYFINWFGRINNVTGILRNRTDGGEGSSGLHVTEEVRLNISASQRKRIENRNHHFQTRPDGTSLSQEVQRKRVEEKTHHFQTRPDGTNLQTDRVANNTNPFQKREDGTSIASDMVENGTHHLLKNKGLVACYNKQGDYIRIPKEQYHSQTGQREEWEYVYICSKEGQRRKSIQNPKSEPSTHNKGKIPCYDKFGNFIRIDIEIYKSQFGPMENWDYVNMNSKEGKIRRMNY